MNDFRKNRGVYFGFNLFALGPKNFLEKMVTRHKFPFPIKEKENIFNWNQKFEKTKKEKLANS